LCHSGLETQFDRWPSWSAYKSKGENAPSNLVLDFRMSSGLQIEERRGPLLQGRLNVSVADREWSDLSSSWMKSSFDYAICDTPFSSSSGRPCCLGCEGLVFVRSARQQTPNSNGISSSRLWVDRFPTSRRRDSMRLPIRGFDNACGAFQGVRG
jgi:hypothetical protein